MRRLSVIWVVVALCVNSPRTYTIAQTSQRTQGDCSPAIANQSGTVKIVIEGCKGVSPEVLAKWQKELNAQYRQLLRANATQAAALRGLRKELESFRRSHDNVVIYNSFDPDIGELTPQEKARARLNMLGVAWNSETFVQALIDGDLRSLALFLDGGMSPLILHKGSSAILYGIQPEGKNNPVAILKLIVSKGFDVNTQLEDYRIMRHWGGDSLPPRFDHKHAPKGYTGGYWGGKFKGSVLLWLVMVATYRGYTEDDLAVVDYLLDHGARVKTSYYFLEYSKEWLSDTTPYQKIFPIIAKRSKKYIIIRAREYGSSKRLARADVHGVRIGMSLEEVVRIVDRRYRSHSNIPIEHEKHGVKWTGNYISIPGELTGDDNKFDAKADQAFIVDFSNPPLKQAVISVTAYESFNRAVAPSLLKTERGLINQYGPWDSLHSERLNEKYYFWGGAPGEDGTCITGKSFSIVYPGGRLYDLIRGESSNSIICQGYGKWKACIKDISEFYAYDKYLSACGMQALAYVKFKNKGDKKNSSVIEVVKYIADYNAIKKSREALAAASD